MSLPSLSDSAVGVPAEGVAASSPGLTEMAFRGRNNKRRMATRHPCRVTGAVEARKCPPEKERQQFQSKKHGLDRILRTVRPARSHRSPPERLWGDAPLPR